MSLAKQNTASRNSWTFALGILCLFLLSASVIASEEQNDNSPAVWFAHPAELPKDVFDLPYFDEDRPGGKFNFQSAQKRLEKLSDDNLPMAQRLFDIFAWRAFAALNSPALPNGQPDLSRSLGDVGSGPLVWEFWQQPSNIFLPDRAVPKWANSPDHTMDHYKAGWRQTPSVNEGKQAFSGPLVDQQGHWVHYVSLVNRREFDYFVENGLYFLEGQEAFSENHQVRFPVNTDTDYGAIEIKLAWKRLSDAEIASHRFLVRDMPVVSYRPSCSTPPDAVIPAHKSGNAADNENSRRTPTQTLGLIGMHIAMRTRSSPQWIWATFEQIDNTRLDLTSGDDNHKLPSHPSLANPDNPRALVSANLLPDYNGPSCNGKPANDWDEAPNEGNHSLNKPESLPPGFLPPVEVMRLVPPPQGTERVNIEAQAFLKSKNSVLRFYELDGTQWPKHPKSPAVPGGEGTAPESIIRKMPGEMVPVYLTNATMETYFQKGFQVAGPLEQDNRLTSNTLTDSKMVFGTESCVGCHYSAGICIGFRKDAAGKLILDSNGNKIPIFGENGNDGLNGNGNFSWLLQLEPKAKYPKSDPPRE
jgi:hypothetical protein